MKINPIAVLLWAFAAAVGYLIGDTLRAALIGAVSMFSFSLLVYVLEPLWNPKAR